MLLQYFSNLLHSVNNLREGLYHEFKKCGKVKSVVIRGDNTNRYALVLFRSATEAHKAINHSRTKLLFGSSFEAALYDGEGRNAIQLFIGELYYAKHGEGL